MAKSPAWPSSASDETIVEFLRDARYHGVTPLLDAQWHRKRPPSNWPDAIRRSCHADALAEAAHELMRRAETTRVLAALATSGVEALLMKGTALAYSRYANSALRPRADCDLLVAPLTRETAAHAIRGLGYRRVSGPAGRYVGYQIELRCDDSRGVAHSVDLHWRISNAQSFAWLFAFDELAAASAPVPPLGPNARRLGDAHALIIALLHRVGNNVFVARDFGDRLIWLYDIVLLVEAMSADDLLLFKRLVEDRGVVAMAIEGLARCAEYFRSPRVAALAAELRSSDAARSGARLVRAHGMRREWLELCAIPAPAARLRYLATRLFPSAEYLRERFPGDAERALPILHARRWLEGVAGRLPIRRR